MFKIGNLVPNWQQTGISNVFMLCSKAWLHFKVVNFDSLPIEFCHNLEPHKIEFFLSNTPLFPITEWLFNYNFSWEIIHYGWTVPILKLLILQNMFTINVFKENTWSWNLILTLNVSSLNKILKVKLFHSKIDVLNNKWFYCNLWS